MQSKRVALVTGGMGGLGEAIARRLYDAGYETLVTYSPSNAHVDAWLTREHEGGREFRAYQVDVADFDASAQCGARILEEVGSVDVLVNNAGITRDSTFLKMTRADWEAVMHTDLDAVFNMTKPFCAGMAQRGWGRIINISSVNGSRGAFGQANYAAAKAGIHGITKSLALELARKGVTVNTISPGYLATAMVTAVPKDVLEQKILPQIPVGRLGDPDEVGALVAFLCSDAAGFITGANLAINGGMHMA